MGNICGNGHPDEIVVENAPNNMPERAQTESWDKNFPPMTKAQLLSKRQEFWETRVEGRPEMWQAIRMAAEAGDATTAQTIVREAGLTPYDIESPGYCFCYDTLGNRYEVPMFVLYEPRNLSASADVALAVPLTAEEKKLESADIQFKIRLSNGLGDLDVTTKGKETIGEVKRRVFEWQKVPVDRQRAIYRGRELRDDASLVQSHVEEGTCIQIMVRADPTPSTPPSTHVTPS